MDLLELLAPSRCLVCGVAGARCCRACRDALRPLPPPLCPRCGRPTAHAVRRCRECSSWRPAFATARAAVALDGPASVLVRRWKDTGLVRAAEVAAELVLTAVPPPRVDVVVPVPARPERARRRGSDPPGRLASALGAAWALPVAPDALRRAGGRPQRGLARDERRRNAATAFRAGSALPSGASRVVLVDDVYTTGATAHACARLLRAAGATSVDVVTFARVVR